jgi:anthranilate synthase component 2
MIRVLILDNYDSFTYNLYHLVEKVAHVSISVERNNLLQPEAVAGFDKIIFSPGPGLPAQAGMMPLLIKEYAHSKSMLGVCLGHQAIAEHCGAKLKNLEYVSHGKGLKTMVVVEDLLFKNIPNTFLSARYHSWVVDPTGLPQVLEITATDENNEIMAIRHKNFDVRGIQFHPESILSQYGEEIMTNWLSN